VSHVAGAVAWQAPARGAGGMSVDIANESGFEVSETALAALATYVLGQMRINPLAELSVLLIDENAMADLHQRWMGEPGPTDVLAFPMDELRPPIGGSASHRNAGGHDADPEPSLLGDVVLCPQIAAKQASAAGHSPEDEIELLCTHGILHLLGYDHADTREHATMFGLQERLLASWHASGGGIRAHPGAGTPGGGGRQEGPG
jgi:probable rRNA maturation factor